MSKPKKTVLKRIVRLSEEDLDTLIITLLLHQNARMDAMAKLPAPSSQELGSFSRDG